ncbi:rRNA methyltransferase 2, mitochondrial [Lampris incognitus]|uniref:rRNA methyltransferase 2, mitochondrial n=1 Tax=Lampris incognitus TaxID=2546036 RepID=UPI0024B526B8|nr:rRNA methyltransferase 2, mitochondrial [Lampris incognitus]
MWLSAVHKRCLHTSLRLLKKSPKTLKGRTTTAQHWLFRQLNDPFVKASHDLNYRCRSAFKLLEIDDRFDILRPGYSVVDCGAAPGAWSQVAVERVNSNGKNTDLPCGTVIGIDLLNIASLDGAHFLSSHDITDPVTHARILELLPNKQAHVILSDMAPNASGFKEMDHEKLITMCFTLLDLAERVLQPEGTLVCKYWDGIFAPKLQEKLSDVFSGVRVLKPKACRKDSAELFFLARMYKKPAK